MLDTPPLSLYHCPALSEYSLCETDSSKAEEWAEHLVGHGFPSFVLPEVFVTAHCPLLPGPHHLNVCALASQQAFQNTGLGTGAEEAVILRFHPGTKDSPLLESRLEKVHF